MPETPANAETTKISGRLPKKEKLLRQGGHQGGSVGPLSPGASDHGIVRDERGQEQPRDKQRARDASREDRGDDPPGEKA